MAVTVWRWPCGGGRVAVAVWRWPCGGGRVAVAVWPCGGHMTCHVTWQDNPLRVTPYILLSSLLSIVSYLGGSVMRGASALITADYLNRFSNSSLMSRGELHIVRFF